MMEPRRVCAVALVLCGVPAAQAKPQKQEKVYYGYAHVFRVHPRLGRALGWSPRDATDDQILDAAAAALKRRLRTSTGKFVEAQVAREVGPHVSVTVIGQMAASYEKLLREGLCGPGRLGFALVARDADLPGSDLAAERERLAAWREQHPKADLADYHLVAREAGGPHPALVWLPVREPGAAPVPTLRSPWFGIAPTDMAKGLHLLDEPESRYCIRFELTEAAAARRATFAHEHAGREVALMANGIAQRTEPIAEGVGITIGHGFPLEEARNVLFAVVGGALPAPLTYVHKTRKPLVNVKRSGDSTQKKG